MEKIAEKIYKIPTDCNVYFLDFTKKIIIDTGKPMHRTFIEKELRKKISPEKIDLVLLTHLHYDHVGNISLFPNAKYYASATEIDAFQQDPFGAILNIEVVNQFTASLQSVEKLNLKQFCLEVISSPGHTKGSVCFYYAKEKILFSGDTLFRAAHGRVDLPTSMPKEMMRSLLKLKKLDYTILCPGHDY